MSEICDESSIKISKPSKANIITPIDFITVVPIYLCNILSLIVFTSGYNKFLLDIPILPEETGFFAI